jgi:pyrroloquinoline quinone (PQQ) biosynthesis protein C
MSFFDRLQSETQQERQQLLSVPLIEKALNGTITLSEYKSFLQEAYHHVKHTVPLMMATGSRIPEQKEWLREAVAEYIEEELGHQEWILNDIESCGFDKQAARNSKPSMATELMISYAYDTIQRVNPIGFFGMVQVLEGTSISVADQAANKIRETLSLPEKAFSYLYSHGALDIEHMKFFENLMNKIDDKEEQDQIIHYAKVFYKLYADIFRFVVTSNDSSNPIGNDYPDKVANF